MAEKSCPIEQEKAAQTHRVLLCASLHTSLMYHQTPEHFSNGRVEYLMREHARSSSDPQQNLPSPGEAAMTSARCRQSPAAGEESSSIAAREDPAPEHSAAGCIPGESLFMSLPGSAQHLPAGSWSCQRPCRDERWDGELPPTCRTTSCSNISLHSDVLGDGENFLFELNQI